MSTYWGNLPAPTVTRGNSINRGGKGKNDLSINTDTHTAMLGGRSPSPSQSRQQQRFSSQTDKTYAPTLSTQSPFASPIASEFRGHGLAPRPPSFPSGTSDATYNRDYLEKRRRRESRNREQYNAPSPVPPPAAPDVPRAPPPVSYRAPYSNNTPTNHQSPARARSTRKSEGPVSPGRGPPDDYYRNHPREEYLPGDEDNFSARRPSNGKAPERHSASQRGGVDRSETTNSNRRKASLSEAKTQRRREWAPDRSPLQRLELTLDSITKEEKRARVEEAELLAREAKAGRGGERANQNSVRFRNRPVAKAAEPGTTQPEPQSLAEAGLVRNLSAKQKDDLRRSGIVETAKPSDIDASPTVGRGFEYQSPPAHNQAPVKTEKVTTPERASSSRDRSYIPVAVAGGAAAAGIARSGSNKLRKDPPGDPWFNKRLDAENRYPDVNVPRKTSVSNRRPDHVDTTPLRDTAFGGHPQALRDKELPSLPREETDEMESNSRPVRRGTLSKAQKVTGEVIPSEAMLREQVNVQTHRGFLNGNSRAAQTSTHPRIQQNATHTEAQSNSHHFNNTLNHFRHHGSAQYGGVYVPSNRLDEWKKGGTALLSGPLLDLDMGHDKDEQAEIEKDKAWWEAGNEGHRRRSSNSTPRKAEAYDGEYDDSSGMQHQLLSLEQCAGCASEGLFRATASSIRSRHNLGRRSMRSMKSNLQPSATSKADPSNMLSPNPILRPHALTCSTRPVRVRPDIAPTRFKPPLFLKSGPLLRYCGIRKEKIKSRSGRADMNREIWRGSIMIVTQDDNSSYELAPTLRLFLQPMNLLPPPPAQVDGAMDEVAPEYIDPIAGLPKLGRDGRTLYIRPIDSIEEEKDLSREESDDGLFESQRSAFDGAGDRKCSPKPHYDGERAGKYKEVRGFRLHAEHGMTFWRFNIEVELRDKQQRIAYRINRGPATGFWVPATGAPMNIMFYSCNGFSHGIDPNQFCGPDPMWRDVLNTHQTQPFHVMLGGGDQIYNDAVMEETKLYKEWSLIKDVHHKENLPFTPEMQAELELFYLSRYSMWFSQGLFSVATAQIPMVNIFDDHDIIDGFGSYPDEYMRSPVFAGLGAVAFKYYMLFQHQSSIDEGEETEASWILGTQPGPYIKELSRSIFTNLGNIAFLGLDGRTERTQDEIMSAETYHKVFDRLGTDIVKGETKHLIVMVGIPVAYPRMVWLENILTSRAMEPIKALARQGLLGKKLLNHMDGGVEILDDLDDHWTAKHHKDERNWLIQELQDLAAEKSVRVTILGGDVHLAAIGQFYSNPQLGLAKDHDFRYMPNVISSAIVNTPPPDKLADLLNKRNKVHHLDAETDEDMIPIFTRDVNMKPRNNKRLLNRRNWCSIREYNPELSPPPTPQTDGPSSPPPKRGLLRRLSTSRGPSYRPDAAPPPSNAAFFARNGSYNSPPISNAGFFARRGSTNSRRGSVDSQRPGVITRTLSLTRKDFLPTGLFRRSSKKKSDSGGINGYGDYSETESEPEEDDRRHPNTYHDATGIRGGSGGDEDRDESYFPAMPKPTGRTPEYPVNQAQTSVAGSTPQQGFARSKFQRTPTGLSEKQIRERGPVAEINLEGGLDICLNMEVSCKDPAGITMPYRLLVPALWYDESQDHLIDTKRSRRGLMRWGTLKRDKGKGKEIE